MKSYKPSCYYAIIDRQSMVGFVSAMVKLGYQIVMVRDHPEFTDTSEVWFEKIPNEYMERKPTDSV